METTAMAVRFRLQAVLDEQDPVMSQSELARRSGVSLVTINAMAKNRTVQVSLKTLDAICGTLGIDVGELFERDIPAKRRGR